MTDLTDKQLLQATFEEVGTIKEDVTELKSEMVEIKSEMVEIKSEMVEIKDQIDQNQEETNVKLDKILEVVSEKFASHHRRISKIENHLGFATLN